MWVLKGKESFSAVVPAGSGGGGMTTVQSKRLNDTGSENGGGAISQGMQ